MACKGETHKAQSEDEHLFLRSGGVGRSSTVGSLDMEASGRSTHIQGQRFRAWENRVSMKEPWFASYWWKGLHILFLSLSHGFLIQGAFFLSFNYQWDCMSSQFIHTQKPVHTHVSLSDAGRHRLASLRRAPHRLRSSVSLDGNVPQNHGDLSPIISNTRVEIMADWTVSDLIWSDLIWSYLIWFDLIWSDLIEHQCGNHGEQLSPIR